MPSGRGGGSTHPGRPGGESGERGSRVGSSRNNGGDNGGGGNNSPSPTPKDMGVDIDRVGDFKDRTATETFGQDYGADEPSEFSVGFSAKALSIKFEPQISVNTDGVLAGSFTGGFLGSSVNVEGSVDLDYEDGKFSTKDQNYNLDASFMDYKSSGDALEDILSVGGRGSMVSNLFDASGGVNIGVGSVDYIGLRGDIHGSVGIGNVGTSGGYDTVVGYNSKEKYFGGETNYKAGVEAFGYSADWEYTDKNILYVPPILIDLNGDGVELVSLDESAAFLITIMIVI